MNKKRKVNVLTYLTLIYIYVLYGNINLAKSNLNNKQRLTLAGASFPSAFYRKVLYKQYKEGGPKVTYQAVGSGFGLKALMSKTIDIAASDDPIDFTKYEKKDILQFPIIGGNIVIGYNKTDCNLKLSQKDLVKLANGEISNWNYFNCKKGPITWVYRSDASGTTKSFARSLTKFSEEWKLGIGKSIMWQSGIGSKGNAGVATRIKLTEGSIGYLNQSFVKYPIQTAAIQNKAGEYIYPTKYSGELTLEDINLDKNLSGFNPNPIKKGSYPLSYLTWILVYKDSLYSSKSSAIKITINNLLSKKSQQLAQELGYVPLTYKIIKLSKSKLDEFK